MIPNHPFAVHLPLALAVLLPFVALPVAVAARRRELRASTWVALATLEMLLVVSSFVAMQTGEAEEERVEQVVGRQAVHVHEEAAEAFLWSTVLALALALAALRFAVARVFLLPGLALTQLLVAALALRAGQLGGELVYKHGAANAYLYQRDDAVPQ